MNNENFYQKINIKNQKNLELRMKYTNLIKIKMLNSNKFIQNICNNYNVDIILFYYDK